MEQIENASTEYSKYGQLTEQGQEGLVGQHQTEAQTTAGERSNTHGVEIATDELNDVDDEVGQTLLLEQVLSMLQCPETGLPLVVL